MNNQRPFKRRGFTLVEILTVLAVITVLSALVFAVFGSMREKGRQTTCANNLKQIALAVQQYVQDSDGKYPLIGASTEESKNAHGWFWLYRLRGYLKNPQLQFCPSYGGEHSPGSDTDYLYNHRRLQQGNLKREPDGRLWVDGQHEALLLNPATTWLNTDMDAAMINQVGVESSLPTYTGSCGRSFGWEIRHSGGANYSFVDGHVQWLRPEQMSEVECSNGPIPPRARDF